jgi:hypothetical protein
MSKTKSLGELVLSEANAMRQEHGLPPLACEPEEATPRRSRKPKPGTIHEMALSLPKCIAFMSKGHAEAYAEAKAAGCDDNEASESANRAWRCLLPLLSSRPAVQVYIGCVAHGLAHNYLSAEEARVMMYSAQMALAVLKKASAA